jgi:DnaJ-class molecular chaperone
MPGCSTPMAWGRRIVAKREVCPMCKGCGHIIVLNWPEHCPKCKRTGFVKPEPKKPADGVKEDGNG